ncbi:efflux RND transporter periplasmic adaptor subunit [Arenimonas sp. GDDSR-1]|uniref:efflux RND transporter periplasmic adaptor subunit n=1 Tax=Arenimonas sp. GDDSR-1 TaxID=2950125 RepID=UPI002607AD75|nr:efflux RND transporter periplasmic adaptor subunit [Arenimonas sp. GDDSR-1]
MRFVLMASVLLMTACSSGDVGSGKEGGPPATVTVVRVAPETWSDRIQAIGTAKARDSVVIAAKQSERIAAVRFESGQRVAKGQVLVELDAGTVKAELAEAQANLNDLNAQVARLQNLQSRQLVAKSQLDTVMASRNAARARVQAAQERLNDRIIRAPFSGVLGLRQVSQGQFVNAGAVMVNLDDLDHLWVDFPVPESLLPQLKTGMTLELQADAAPGQTLPARVVGIDSRVDVATRAIMVRGAIDNAAGLVRPGMLMRVSLQQEAVQALVVPELAVQQVGNRTFVFVANTDGTAASRDIRIGSRHLGKAVVLEGLKSGENVVLDGTSKLRDGQKLKVVPATP